MLNPKNNNKHYEIFLSCSNVSGVQVGLKHKLSKEIYGSVMQYTNRYKKISTLPHNICSSINSPLADMLISL